MTRVVLIACPAMILALSTPAFTSDFVRIKAATASIRAAPHSGSEVVARASEGQVFHANSKTSCWYEIDMFASEYRYVSVALVEPVSSPPPLPRSEATLRRACHEIVAAQDRADREAERRYPVDYKKQIGLQFVLYDRYELPVFLRYDIAPAHGAHLTVQCAQHHWL